VACVCNRGLGLLNSPWCNWRLYPELRYNYWYSAEVKPIERMIDDWNTNEAREAQKWREDYVEWITEERR
jgi:hypothetical protein